MIRIKGKSFNFEEPAVCRISVVSKDKDRAEFEYIFMGNNGRRGIGNGLIALNTKEEIDDSYTPLFVCSNNTIEASINDIYYIEPKGYAIKLIDSTSLTNSLFITEKCNYKCMMCPQPPVKINTIDWPQIALKTVEMLDSDFPCIGITGGEPTLEWKSLIKVINACSKKHPETTLQILTNASIFKKYSMAKKLYEASCDNIFLGIPLYSDTHLVHDELCGFKGAFYNTIDGIYNLERCGIPIELRIVIMKQNYSRLPQFSEFVYRNFPFIGAIAFMAIEPIGNALKNFDSLWIEPGMYMDSLAKAVRILYRAGVNVSIFNHQNCMLDKKLWKFSRKAISEWKIRYLDCCDKCLARHDCGGFFFSSKKHLSHMIKPIC